MTVHSFYDRQPTPDERMGMKWWNALSKSERGDWLSTAETVAQAWTMFKQGEPRPSR
jgi:hypothetical protein